jgi:hypothetical protein
MSTSSTRSSKRRHWQAIGLAAMTLLAPLFWLHDANVEHHQSLCPFKAITGFPCPGCGITRSLVFLYRGDLSTSVHYHWFGVPLVLFCIAVITVSLIEMRTGQRYFRKLLFNMPLAWGLGIVLCGYHLVRLWTFVGTHSVNDILQESIWQ